jgi:hypothetical protein
MSTQGENNKIIQDFGLTTTRRNFIKKAAISAPIIAAVSSRPVWATANSAVSGNLSGNLSTPNDEIPPVNGQSPGYWQGGQPTGKRIDDVSGVVQGTSFASLFYQTSIEDPAGLGWTASYTNSLLTAVQDTGNQPERFAAAAYLNAASNNAGFGGYPYSTAQIIDFYGYYHRGEITAAEIQSVFVNLTHCGNNTPAGQSC